MQAFLRSKKSSCSAGTLDFYTRKLAEFLLWLGPQAGRVEDIRPQHIREFLTELAQGHAPGGVHAYYRSLRTWVNWCRKEYDTEWNPLRNVQAPRAMHEAMGAADIEDIKKLLRACDHRTFVGSRDDAIIRTLLDTGLRASELLRLDLEDTDVTEGRITVPAAKTEGKVARSAFLGSHAARALRRYAAMRSTRAESPALWLTQEGTRMTYAGLHTMLRRLSERAGVEGRVTPHEIRKAFATAMHRSGADLETIRRLLGHSSIIVTQTYLRLTDDDLHRVHEAHSPGDRLL